MKIPNLLFSNYLIPAIAKTFETMWIRKGRELFTEDLGLCERSIHQLPGRFKLINFIGFQRPGPVIPRSPNGHHQDRVDASKGSAPTLSNFEYAGLLTEANHLCDIDFREGWKLS